MRRSGLSFGGCLLMCLSLNAEVITLWNFNSQPWDADFNTGTLLPIIGNGTAARVGAVTQSFTASNGSSDSQADNSNWRITGWPAQGTGNKSHGVRFNVSTVGYRRIRLEFGLRNSNTASKYSRVQYTTNGVNFMDHVVITMPAETWTNEQSVSFDGLPGVENNLNFGFRFVTEFQNSATGTGSASDLPSATGSGYGLNGTLRFDMIIVSGDPMTPSPNRTVKWFDYNVWGAGATNWPPSNPQVQAIGRQLAYLAPDVVTLQEVPDSGLFNMPGIVAAYLPGCFLATNRVSDGDKGNLVLSRCQSSARVRTWVAVRSRTGVTTACSRGICSKRRLPCRASTSRCTHSQYT